MIVETIKETQAMPGIKRLKLTVDDLDPMPDDDKKYELINGEIWTDGGALVPRAAHVNHQTILLNLSGAFFVYLKQNPIGKAIPEPGLIIGGFGTVIPDLVFISNEKYESAVSEEGRLTTAPELVIEILSFGTNDIRRDRNVKRKLYGDCGVQEYWIADSRFVSVDVFRLDESILEHEKTYKLEHEITSQLLPGFSLKVPEIFRF